MPDPTPAPENHPEAARATRGELLALVAARPDLWVLAEACLELVRIRPLQIQEFERRFPAHLVEKDMLLRAEALGWLRSALDEDRMI